MLTPHQVDRPTSVISCRQVDLRSVLGFLCCAKNFQLMQSQGGVSPQNITGRDVREFTARVFFQGFYGLGLTFKSLVHFEFILVYGIRR